MTKSEFERAAVEAHPNSLHVLESEARRAGRVFRWTHGQGGGWVKTWEHLRARLDADTADGLEHRMYLAWCGVAADDTARRLVQVPSGDDQQGTLWNTCEPYLR